MAALRLGPEHGDLSLRTGVDGLAAKLGHGLVLRLTAWEAEADFAGDEPSAVRMRARVDSLEVLRGIGGPRLLSARDLGAIRRNALELVCADRHPEVVFGSTSVRRTESGYLVQGALTIAGTTRSLAMPVTVADAGASMALMATAPVVQSEFGVTPYSAFAGALRVRDLVEVRLDLTVHKP